MIKKIDHIGVVVSDIKEALKIYQQALGLNLAKIQERPDQAVTIAFLPTGVAKFLQKRGEGIHHICLEVNDIEKTLADLQEKGLQLIDESPRMGPEGERFAFIHPKSAHGVLIELYEYPESAKTHE
jgi:methylmalonyl-CoA epimerase